MISSLTLNELSIMEEQFCSLVKLEKVVQNRKDWWASCKNCEQNKCEIIFGVKRSVCSENSVKIGCVNWCCNPKSAFSEQHSIKSAVSGLWVFRSVIISKWKFQNENRKYTITSNHWGRIKSKFLWKYVNATKKIKIRVIECGEFHNTVQ